MTSEFILETRDLTKEFKGFVAVDAEIEDPHDPVEVGMVARSFDSCLVCTVHAHDAKTGEKLAKFKL